jgi:hypothetical protein
MADHIDDPQGDEKPGVHLPPPAFPPGNRRTHTRRNRNSTVEGEVEGSDQFPADAFISPDEPIVRVAEFPDDAFISPDEPIVQRDPHEIEMEEDEEVDPDEVVVTGMGGETVYDKTASTPAAFRDDEYLELADRLEALAHQIRERGIAALVVRSDTHTFDAVLRSLVAGFMAGRD